MRRGAVLVAVTLAAAGCVSVPSLWSGTPMREQP